MNYLELTITTTQDAEELVASKLWEFSSYGVSICNDKDILELINDRRNTWDYIEDSVLENLGYRATLVKCYLDLDTPNETIISISEELNQLKENAKGFIEFGSLEIVKRIVDGDDWIEVWRKHYRPMDMGKVVICPKWVEYQNNEKIVVKIDSNMAFGTGEHETTSMCIDFLIKYVNGGEKVIDVGTGSGILGITAVLLGAKQSVMTDIDEVAVETAKLNAVLNNVEDKCYITLDNLLDKTKCVGDIVVANITADILAILCDDISTHCKEHTKLILSGILRERVNIVLDKYLSSGFKIINSESKGEWIALCLEKV